MKVDVLAVMDRIIRHRTYEAANGDVIYTDIAGIEAARGAIADLIDAAGFVCGRSWPAAGSDPNQKIEMDALRAALAKVSP